jgi:hypothetical protein
LMVAVALMLGLIAGVAIALLRALGKLLDR